MNKKLSTIININEIHSICKEYFEDNKIEFSEEKFEEFLKFLKIDFYDWVKENIRQFYNRKKE